jgi:hypothetical protein
VAPQLVGIQTPLNINADDVSDMKYSMYLPLKTNLKDLAETYILSSVVVYENDHFIAYIRNCHNHWFEIDDHSLKRVSLTQLQEIFAKGTSFCFYTIEDSYSFVTDSSSQCSSVTTSNNRNMMINSTESSNHFFNDIIKANGADVATMISLKDRSVDVESNRFWLAHFEKQENAKSNQEEGVALVKTLSIDSDGSLCIAEVPPLERWHIENNECYRSLLVQRDRDLIFLVTEHITGKECYQTQWLRHSNGEYFPIEGALCSYFKVASGESLEKIFHSPNTHPPMCCLQLAK